MSVHKVYPVTSHTDHVGPNSTFVVVKGMKEDGVAYIPLALARGARTIVVEQGVQLTPALEQEIAHHGATVVRVENARLALAQLSAQAWGYPANKLTIIGITGTKGKTTTSFILAHLFAHAGKRTALLSTVYNKLGDHILPTHLTTQHPDYLHMFFAQCVEQGITHVVMEVAAQAMTLHRVAGIPFAAAAFTNFAQEHGEFYASMDDYLRAKCQLLAQVADPKNVFVNGDDATGARILVQHPYTRLGLNQVQVHKNDRTGLVFEFRPAWFDTIFASRKSLTTSGSGDEVPVLQAPALLGTHNLYNLLIAITLAYRFGLTLHEIQAGLATFAGVPGRLERYGLPNGSVGVIDYAHNPSSFQAILPLLRQLTPKLIVVFGCGGDRESGKRPLMGAIAAQIADLVIVTTDNPRTEDPALITQQILAGVPGELRHKIIAELDREKAIRQAYAQAGEQAIIALLGKGPEEYQVVGSVKVPFSERAILQSLI